MRDKSSDQQGGLVRYGDNLLPCLKSSSPFGTGLQGVSQLPLKRAQRFPRSQHMASITDHHWMQWLSRYWSYFCACVCGRGSKKKEFCFLQKISRCLLGVGDLVMSRESLGLEDICLGQGTKVSTIRLISLRF